MTSVALLLASVAILAAVILIQATQGTLAHGLAHSLGNREEGPATAGLAGRIDRTRANTIENLALSVPLLLLVIATDTWNPWVAIGGTVFVVARALYVVAYLAGVPGLRTALWFAGFVGTLLTGVGAFVG